jgi:hypothetical protein
VYINIVSLNMDTFIPVILAIAFFIFQAYLGVKKEQEKAAKRNLGKPGSPPVVAHPEPVKKDSPPKRDWLEELLNPEMPQPTQPKPVLVERPVVATPKESYEQTYVEPRYETFYKPEKYVPTERPVSLLAEYRRLSTYDEDGEIKRAKKIRADRRKETKRLETLALEVDDLDKERNTIHFNLEEAIVIKAILERPYS